MISMWDDRGVVGVITASDSSWTGPFTGLSPRCFGRLVATLRREGADAPRRDRSIAASSKNYRYSTNHQVIIDAQTRLVTVVGSPLPGNRNDCRAWKESGARTACGKATVIADGGYQAMFGVARLHNLVFAE